MPAISTVAVNPVNQAQRRALLLITHKRSRGLAATPDPNLRVDAHWDSQIGPRAPRYDPAFCCGHPDRARCSTKSWRHSGSVYGVKAL